MNAKNAETNAPKTIRQIIENFDEDKLDLEVFSAQKGDSWRSMSCREVRRLTIALGHALLKTGIKKGDRIVLFSENRLKWLLSYLATTYIGAVIVPLDISLSLSELEPILRKVEAETIFCSEKRFRKIAPLENRIETLKRIINFDASAEMVRQEDSTPSDASASKNFRYLYFDSLIKPGKEPLGNGNAVMPEVMPDDSAALVFMEEEQLVELSHKNIVSNALSFIKTLEYPHQDDRTIAPLPMHHVYTTIFGIIMPLLSYSRAIFVASAKNETLLRAAKKVSANCITMVPLTMERLYLDIYVRLKKVVKDWELSAFSSINDFFDSVMEREEGRSAMENIRKDFGLDWIKFIFVGATPVPPWLVSGMEKLGFNVLIGYGLSESPGVAFSSFRARRLGSVGSAISGMEIKVDKPDENGEGELLARGPNIMLGYYKLPEKTKKTFVEGGWFRTGDLGRIDEEGFVYVTGRLKNVIINRGGKNIYPGDIEKKLRRSPYFADAVVKSGTDEKGGECPRAFLRLDHEALASIEKEKGRKLSGEEVCELAKKEVAKSVRGLASYKIPREFEIVADESSLNKIRSAVFRVPAFSPLTPDSPSVKALEKKIDKSFKND